MTKITIVFATFNGEYTLPRMLSALCRLERPIEGLQIIAVDNGSTDQTSDILKSFRDRLPLDIIYEPVRGKNCALNSALSAIQGDNVIFTDDDVIPDSNWLTVYQACAEKHTDCDLFGGAIIPHWEVSPEPWMHSAIPQGVTFALTPPDQKEGPIFPGLIWGANMMVRGSIFKAGHRFNDRVGPSAGQYIMGSETEFNIRVASHGHQTWFCPDAKVKHIIRSQQMTKSWVIQRAFRFGRNMCYQDYLKSGYFNSDAWLFGRMNFPRWMARRFIDCKILSILATFKCNQIDSIRYEWDAQYFFGYMKQAQLFYKQISMTKKNF